jgi:hypothetical protein
MEERLESVLATISQAFAERGLPEGDPVFTAGSPELDSDRLATLARQCRWLDLPGELLCGNSIALALASPPAFAYLLPACMTVSLKRYPECGALTSMLLTCLTPVDESDAETMAGLEGDFERLEPGVLEESASPDVFAETEGEREVFAARVAVLTAEEREAVRAYLRCLDEVHGDDFPAFGPRQALERFWDTGEAGGSGR